MAEADEMDQKPRSPTMAPARDPARAVDEEYRMAVARGTAEALALFIARHGDDPLAEKAKAELRRIQDGARR